MRVNRFFQAFFSCTTPPKPLYSARTERFQCFFFSSTANRCTTFITFKLITHLQVVLREGSLPTTAPLALRCRPSCTPTFSPQGGGIDSRFKNVKPSFENNLIFLYKKGSKVLELLNVFLKCVIKVCIISVPRKSVCTTPPCHCFSWYQFQTSEYLQFLHT